MLNTKPRIKFRTFAYCLVSMLVLYLLFNLCVWHLWAKNLFGKDATVGDLSRLGYQIKSIASKQDPTDLPIKHIDKEKFTSQNVDVITVGDSFSNGGAGVFYQDQIASFNKFSVLNIDNYTKLNQIGTISVLLNNGYIDGITPKYVLIECAEKFCHELGSDRIDFDKSTSKEELSRYEVLNYKIKPDNNTTASYMDFFNEANVRFIAQNITYRFSDKGFNGQVYRARLKKDLFTVSAANTLLFHRDDISNQNKNKERVTKVNDNLNTLADRLDKKGIKLYFMPCVDKYDLYRDFIVKSKHPKSSFFEELRKMPKKYTFIDTKEILTEELKKGEKDIYYADETHWSWKASKAVFQKVTFK